MGRVLLEQRPAGGLAQPLAAAGPVDRRPVHERSGLVHHAEGSGLQVCLDVLRRAAHARDLHVVDRRRAVHRHVRDEPALHPLDEARRHAHLDDVPADHDHDGSPGAVGRGRPRDHLAQRARRQLVGERADQRGGGRGLERPRELRHRDLRRPLGGAQAPEPGEIRLAVTPH